MSLYEEIMERLGRPQSKALLLALEQVAYETSKNCQGVTPARVLDIVDICFHMYASDYRADAQKMAKKLLA